MALNNSENKTKKPSDELRYLTSPNVPEKLDKRYCFFTRVNKKNKQLVKSGELSTYHNFYIDYKDPKFLLTFCLTTGAIAPRRKTGVCLKYQKKLAIAIKRARHLGLLPFVEYGLK